MAAEKEYWTLFYFSSKSILPSIHTLSREEYHSLAVGESFVTEGDVIIIVHTTSAETR